jgi:hypothetical protein
MQACPRGSSEDQERPRDRERGPCSSVSTPGRHRGGAASAALAGLLVLLSGCTHLKEYIHNGFKVGPNYSRPPAPVAEDWIDTADPRLRKESDDLSW